MKVIKFEAQWCGPCRAMHKEWEQAKQKCLDVEFEVCDIDLNNQMAQQFRIMSIPTIVFVKDGNEVDRKVGYIRVDEIVSAINGLK
jgi:thioredoxin 1